MKISEQLASEMHFSWEMLQEIFKICKSSAGNAAGNLVGNGWGDYAVFSLNMWLKDDILFTKHPQAIMCNSYTFSICVQSLHFDPLLFKFALLAHYCLKSSFWPIIAGSLRVSLFIDLGFP